MKNIKKLTAAALAAIICASSITGIFSVSAADKLPAFPGAEGGGKYTEGARAASKPSIYHVTNLNAEGSGSFADAVSKPGRVIVFDVGGTIELPETFRLLNSNLTILGQTAPGDGITFTGGDLLLNHGLENIIMRYLRIRPTDKNGGEYDGLGGRWNKNIIIDHCSVSWSVDETLTLYAGSSESEQYKPASNITMQNTIGSESLRMSNHFKGAHGYGGIWGGTNASYHHNLLAHHDSRSPRLDRELQKTDVRYNVIYDWGKTNSAYGAEPYSYNNKTQKGSMVNWAGNYYKYGPATSAILRSRIFDVSNGENIKPYAQFYFMNNYVEGFEDVTADNTKGINNIQAADIVSEPFDMGEYELPEQTAAEAYDYVLQNAGATLPKRDAVDARIIADVKNGTGKVINTPDEVAGYLPTEETHRTFEIPQEWIAENNLTGLKETDIIKSGEFAGYMLIEAYVNDWTERQELPTNPDITVLSPAISSLTDTVNGRKVNNGNWTVISDNETVNYHAVADAVGGYEIEKIELYDKSTLIDTVEDSEINKNLTLSTGTHYLTCRAYNTRGEETQSTEAIVYVTSSEDSEGWKNTQIGSGCFGGKSAGWIDDNGVCFVAGSGKIGPNKDSFGFMYKALKGDFDISVKLDTIPKFENGQVCGLMLRESLAEDSPMIMLADGWLKYGENVRAITRTSKGANAEVKFFKDKDGAEISNASSYNTQEERYTVPSYIRMQRTGNTVTLSVSNSGTDWNDNTRQPMTFTLNELPDILYVGLATDSTMGEAPREYFAIAGFAEMKLTGNEAVNKLWIDENKIYGKTSNDCALLYAAEYKDGILTGVNVKKLESEKEDYLDIPESGNLVKAMLWAENQQPLCKKIEIEK